MKTKTLIEKIFNKENAKYIPISLISLPILWTTIYTKTNPLITNPQKPQQIIYTENINNLQNKISSFCPNNLPEEICSDLNLLQTKLTKYNQTHINSTEIDNYHQKLKETKKTNSKQILFGGLIPLSITLLGASLTIYYLKKLKK